MAGQLWSPQEVDMLHSLVGDLPWAMVSDVYNRWATLNKMPKRSKSSLRGKCHSLGLSTVCIGSWVTSGIVCELLGISYPTVRLWIKNGWLPAKRFGKGPPNPFCFRRKDLCKLARQKPHLFGGHSEATLVQLLDNESLAAEIAAMGLPKSWHRVPVICIERGKRYPSIVSAAKAVYVTQSRLRSVLNTNWTAAGYHWKTA